ncbi:MAG: hypothetical protein LBD13_05075, partial [Spirochaetaceae bacterium]|nr:hypothetical protein [Spirochaetaceae bacterium]
SSIIKYHDTITPSFTRSLANDLDVQGLLVFFRTPEGEIIGRKTRYEIQNSLSGPKKQEAPLDAPADPDSFGGPPAGPDAPPPEAPAGTEKTETETDPAPAIETEAEPAKTAPLPAFESVYQDRIILVDRLDKECPPFPLAENLPIGSYFMVFQVLGSQETLSQTEYPVFFIGDADMAFEDIQYYLPGLSSNAYFVPQGIDILIAARMSADSRLSPYIVWHADKKPAVEGHPADGESGSFIWRVPDKAGFYTIRAELFPFKPPEGAVKARGIEKELSLPVSSKSVVIGYFTDIAGDLRQWYQFQRNLRDSKREGRELRPLDRPSPRWMTSIGLYGLVVGTNNRYRLAGSPFAFAPDEQGRATAVFHLSTADDGAVFAARFKTFDESFKEAPEPVILRMSLRENALVLTLAYQGAALEEPIVLDDLEPKQLLAPRLDIALARHEISAELRLGNAVSPRLTLALPVSLNGEGEFGLGERDAYGGAEAVTAVVDEFGLGFEKTPAGPGAAALAAAAAEQEAPGQGGAE